jgi:hypothetical protein
MPRSNRSASTDEKYSPTDEKRGHKDEIVSVKVLDTAAQLAAVNIGVLDAQESERIKYASDFILSLIE